MDCCLSEHELVSLRTLTVPSEHGPPLSWNIDCRFSEHEPLGPVQAVCPFLLRLLTLSQSRAVSDIAFDQINGRD
eukprot:727169-Rhodomonas_salina.1